MAMSTKEMQDLVSRALNIARRRLALSVEEVAGRANVSSQAVQKHEDGYNLPQLDVFIRELGALGLDFGALHELLIELRTAERVDELKNKLDKLNREVEAIRDSLKPGRSQADEEDTGG